MVQAKLRPVLFWITNSDFFSAHTPQCYIWQLQEMVSHANTHAAELLMNRKMTHPGLPGGPPIGARTAFSHTRVPDEFAEADGTDLGEATTFFPGSATYIPTAVPEGTTHYDGSEFDDQEPVEVEVEVADSRFQENAEEEEDFNEDPCFEVEDEPVVVPAPKKRPRHLWSFPI